MTQRTTVDYDGASLGIHWTSLPTPEGGAEGTTALQCTSRKALTPWDALLRHDTADGVRRRECRLDGNPFAPKDVAVLSSVPARYKGRAWGHTTIYGGTLCVRHTVTTRCCRQKKELCKPLKKTIKVAATSYYCNAKGVADHDAHDASHITPSSSSTQQRLHVGPRLASIVSFTQPFAQQSSRTVNEELLPALVVEAREKLRRLISEHKLASSRGAGVRRILDLGMSRSSSALSSSRTGTLPLGSVMGIMSRSSTTPRSLSLVPRASTTAPGQLMTPAARPAGHSSKWPVVEVWFEGEEAPVLILRDAVHPLDSITALRATINKEFRDMVGGDSLADETNWTFSLFHPPVVVLLSKLLHDFKTFYSDTEHSRYAGALAKEMKLRVARHREQADNLQKYLQIIRLSLESCASVEQLCPRVRMNLDVYKKHHGLPHSRFFDGSLRPHLAPKGPPPSLQEVRCFVAPVMGAIRAQLERMAAKAANPNAPAPPPPTECGIPMFAGSATRVGNRLVSMARRRSALRRYDCDVASGALEASNIRHGQVELAVPRITLRKINPTFSWDRVDVLMSQIEEICRGGRGAALEDQDPIHMDVHAGEDEAMGILLGGVDKGIRSPPRSRSPTSPTGSDRSRSPTQRFGTSPTQSSNGASSSFVVPVLSAEEELRRTLEQGITPLYRCDALGWSNLDYAAWFRRPTIVALLCQFGANPSNQDVTNGDTVLHRFIKARSRTVRELQCFKAILDHTAPRHLLRLLRTHNHQGDTPLRLATNLRDFVVVQAILATAVSPRCRQVMTAARYPSGDEESAMCAVFTFDYFIDECSLPHLLWVENNCFADPANAVGEVLGASLLHRAMMAPSFSVLSSEARDQVIATMLTRVDPLTKDVCDRTAFHCAARSNGCTKWLVPFLDHMHARAGSVMLASSPASFYGSGASTVNRLGSRHQSSHPGMMTGTGKVISQTADAEGNTVLHTALLWCKEQAALDVDICAFVAHPYVLPHIQLDQQNRAGDTVLHLIMQRRQLSLAEILCRSLKYESAGFLQRLFTLRNGDGDTILGCAIKSQFAAGIRRILEVESIAEVSLHARVSDDRLPLLLAVDVLGAKEAVGTLFTVMDQRPHCVAREETDCLSILLRIAQDHRLLHDMIHCTSGPRGETALHGAARHMLWHPCALLMSFGASPNKVDRAGRTSLAIAFAHPHDTSLPRLMMANDTSEWQTGATLQSCLAARGAASCSPAFMDDCFFQRYPFPWTDVNFCAPLLDIAFETGNLFVIERMLCLGVKPASLARADELFALLQGKYREAVTYSERGSRWRRMEHLFVHTTFPMKSSDMRSVVEGLLVTMAEEPALLPTPSYAQLSHAVHANFHKLSESLLQRLKRTEGRNSNEASQGTAHQMTPRPRRVAFCPAVELAGSECYAEWPVRTRRDILCMDSTRLLSSGRAEDCRQWQHAVSVASAMCNMEALTILVTFASSASPVAMREIRQSFPSSQFREVPKALVPHQRECLWLARRYMLHLPLLVTLMIVEGQATALEMLISVYGAANVVDILLQPVRVDGEAVAAIGRRRVLKWALVEGDACPLALALTLSPPLISDVHQMLIDMLLMSIKDPSHLDANVDVVVEGVRDALMASIDCGAWLFVELLMNTVVKSLPVDARQRLLAARPPPDASWSIFRDSPLERLVCSPHALPADMLVWLIPSLLTPLQESFSADTTQRLFRGITRFASLKDGDAPRCAQDDKRQQLRLRDVIVVFLLGGVEHVSLPQRVSANRPSRQQSITALEQMHQDSMQDFASCGELVRALQALATTISLSPMCCNRLAATLTVEYLHVMVVHGLVLSLGHVHCVATQGVFSLVDGSLAQADCAASSLNSTRIKYVSSILLQSNAIPDVIVNAVIDAARAEVAEWRQHTQWWVDHVLDIYHPSNVRRVPVQVRRAFPILSMMRDVARTEPATTRGVLPAINGSVVVSNHTPPSRSYGASPLHCAVLSNREAVVVQMLQEGSRELDVNVQDAYGRTSLAWAAKLGHHSIASQLVSTGVDILIEDKFGLASLAYASDANMVELMLADDDGEDAANSRSSKPHRSSPLMHQLRCGRAGAASALLNSVACENCVLETMVDGVSGETLVHLAAARVELHATVLTALLDGRLPLTYVLLTDAQGWTARDYCAPRSAADLLLEQKGVPRTMRFWPEGKYSVGIRDHRTIRHNVSYLISGAQPTPAPDNIGDEPWKQVLGFHLRRRTEATMTIDEASWERASRGEDRELQLLLERGHRDMQVVRLYGIPAPRNEKDKRSVAKDVNLLLQMRFGGCRGGCRLVFPSDATQQDAPTAAEAHPYLSDDEQNSVAPTAGVLAQEVPHVVPASRLPEGIDPNAPYAAALMIDDTRIPQLMATTSGLTVKNRPLRVIREPPRGPQYRTVVPANTSTLLHQICKTGCIRSLHYVLRNNASQGAPNELICRLLSATYDENGLSPFHVAVVHRQWAIVIELLKNRIPLGLTLAQKRHQHVAPHNQQPQDGLVVGPHQTFASLVQLMAFQWLAGTGTTPSTAKPLVDVLVPACSQWTLSSTTVSHGRFTDFDAEVAAYALMRTAATDIMLLARMQRVVLTSILDASTAAACTAVVTSFADRLEQKVQQHRSLAERGLRNANVLPVRPHSDLSVDHCHSRDRYVLRKLLDHYRNGVMSVDVDHEGADARDSAAERERTKALLMYHVQGGALFRVLEGALFDTFMLAEDLSDESHPSMRVFRWAALLHIDNVRFVCCKNSKTEQPTITVTPSSFNRGCFSVRATFLVDASGVLRCPDLSATLRDFFFTTLLDASWQLCCAVGLHGVHISVLEEEMLLVRRFITSVRARQYLEEQQSTPQPASLDPHHEEEGEDIEEPVDAAMVCWQHLKRRFEDACSGPSGDLDNRSFTSSSNMSVVVVSAQVERLCRFVLDVRTLLVRDAIPQTTLSNAAGEPVEVFLSGGRRVALTQGCEVTIVLHRQTTGDHAAIMEVQRQSDARVSSFDGLALLRRDWQGSSVTNEAQSASTASRAEGAGLRLLEQARRVVEGEQQVFIVCPLVEAIDDIEVGTTFLSTPFSGCSLLRGSQWVGNQVSRYVWKASLWTSLVSSRPSTRPSTATQPPVGGRPPLRGSWVVSPTPSNIDPVTAAIHDQQRPHSVLSLTDISPHIEVDPYATPLEQHVDPPANLTNGTVDAAPMCIPRTLLDLAAALDEQGRLATLCFMQLASKAAVHNNNATEHTTSCRFAGIVQLLAPFLMDDPMFTWTQLRLVNRQTYSAVTASALAGTMLPASIAAERVRGIALMIDDAANCWARSPCLSSGLQARVLEILSSNYLEASLQEAYPFPTHASSWATSRVAHMQFEAFLASPIAMFHHVASIRGVHEASRLPKWLLRRCQRVRSKKNSSQTPPPTRKSQQHPVRLIEVTFAALYPSMSTLWKLHHVVEAQKHEQQL